MPTTLKTWPYGNQRTAAVCVARWHPKELPPDCEGGQLIRDNGEKLCRRGMRQLHRQSRRTGTLTFLRGDPTGGYWQFRETV